MCKAYLDLEFTNLGRRARLISLALVTDSGQELYVELNDNWKLNDCSAFVQQTILPKLDLARHGVSTQQARSRLQAFLRVIAPIDIFSAAPHWDWPLFSWLIGAEGLPAGVRVHELESDHDDERAIMSAPHHALTQARRLALTQDEGCPA